jgi:hypothetical protein
VNNKRKAPSPSSDIHFDSSSSEDEDGSSIDTTLGHKKAKPSPRNGNVEPDYQRRIFREMDDEVDVGEWPIIQGVDLTVGKDKEFRMVFPGEEKVAEVKLRYPSRWPMER